MRIGTAGWAIPRDCATAFPGEGSHLVRYAGVLTCAEINVSFYRSPRASTYVRWATSTPADFRFSVKVPRAITHESALAPSRERMQAFVEEAALLGERLGPILFQLPPRQAFDLRQAKRFFGLFRDLRPDHAAALEPRHPGWFTAEAEAVLRDFRVARVAADPAKVPEASIPGGWDGLVYFRLHGSPRVYYSSYGLEWLELLAGKLRASAEAGSEVWCIFDNTASGAGAGDALALTQLLSCGRLPKK